jgi:intein-encoded DNA endonuclease-like protein
MFLSLYDEVTNVLCVSLLSHDRYQYAHYANNFHNVKSVYFFYSNRDICRVTKGSHIEDL